MKCPNSNKIIVMITFCISLNVNTTEVVPQPWYKRMTSFMTESIWQPVYSQIQRLFSYGGSGLVRLAALVIKQKPASLSSPTTGLTVQQISEHLPYQSGHVRLNIGDISSFQLSQSNPSSLQWAQAGDDNANTYIAFKTEEEMSIGIVFTQEAEGNTSEMDYIKKHFIKTLLKYCKKEGVVEQALLSTFKAIEEYFEKVSRAVAIRGTGFILRGNLLWLFGGMGTALSSSLFKRTQSGIETIFTTKPAPFSPYFLKVYNRFNGDSQNPDRFLGRLTAEKPYFIAQPYITCLQLLPDETYIVVCRNDIATEVIQTTLAQKQTSPLQEQITNIVDSQVNGKSGLLVEIHQSPAQESNVSANVTYALSLGNKKEMQDFITIESNETGFFAAVFDGHGRKKAKDLEGFGKLVAKNATSIFYAALMSELKKVSPPFEELFPTFTKDILIQTGLMVDGALRRSYPKKGGTTATGIFFDKGQGRPYIFNIGDSRTMVFNTLGNVLFRSHDHSIRTSEREQKRIRVMGGRVQGVKEGIFLPYRQARIGRLIPSRVLGDHQSKVKEGAILAYADVIPISLPFNQEEWPVYIVIASDGIWDIYPERGLKKLIESIKRDGTLQEIVDPAALVGQGDNRALLVIALQRQGR